MISSQELSFKQAMWAAKEKCLVRRNAWKEDVHGVLNIPEGHYELPLNGKNRSFIAQSYNAMVVVRPDKAHMAFPYTPTEEDMAASDWAVIVYEFKN